MGARFGTFLRWVELWELGDDESVGLNDWRTRRCEMG